MILAIKQISFFEAQSPFKADRLTFVWSNHVAVFVKTDTLIIVVIEKLYFEFGWFDLGYFASGPSSFASEMTELKHI